MMRPGVVYQGWQGMTRTLPAARALTALLSLLLLFMLPAAVHAAQPSARSGTIARPDVRSATALVVDANDSSVIFAQRDDAVRPIASITKLMTALVVLDGEQPLDEIITITNADRNGARGSASRLGVGTRLSRGELLQLALMSSENRAAQALGRSYPGGLPAFLRAMNDKAAELGMTRSRFADPTGLSSGNVASARDLVKLVQAASAHPLIRSYSTGERHTVKAGKQALEYRNTNALVTKPDWSIAVQKTGYTQAAGQCLVMHTRIDGRSVVIVLLNSFGKYTRIADARRIRKWMESAGRTAS
jgi:D-alanyl-D-alanine endopeptidase (penicillin-binding protein 7)